MVDRRVIIDKAKEIFHNDRSAYEIAKQIGFVRGAEWMEKFLIKKDKNDE